MPSSHGYFTSLVVSDDSIQVLGKDETVAPNEYSASKPILLGGKSARFSLGVIRQVDLYSVHDGSGSVIAEDGELVLFRSDPSLALGSTVLQTLQRLEEMARLSVAAGDWDSDLEGASLHLSTSIPISGRGVLYASWLHKGASTFNDAAGDDEHIDLRLRV